MAYLGNTPTSQNFTSGTDYFSGNGSTTAFTLSRQVSSINDVIVVIENVVQKPLDAYGIVGTTLTFTSAPPSGTNNIYVRYMSTSTITIAPSDLSVTAAKMATGTAVANIGYTPVNKAGDSMTGNLAVQNSSDAIMTTQSTGSASSAILKLIARDSSVDKEFDIVSVGSGLGSNGLRITYNGWTNSPLLNLDTAGNLSFNSGYGSAGLAYGVRAWVSFNGQNTVAIRASGNVSSITDNGTADYSVNFTNSMPDTNYAVAFGSNNVNDSTGTNVCAMNAPVDPSWRTVNKQRFLLANLYNGGFNYSQDASGITLMFVR